MIEKFDEIIEQVSTYTLENDRYKTEEHSLGITIVDKKELENIQDLDVFISKLEEASSLANDYIECETKAGQINSKIYNSFDSIKNKVNTILNFLDVNLELKNIKNRPT